jgi:shikimate 5-dehydrogenase
MPQAACVIGWPIGHSRSPLIHNYWIKEHGLDAEYGREAVPPDQFADFIAHLAERGYVGAKVTVPRLGSRPWVRAGARCRRSGARGRFRPVRWARHRAVGGFQRWFGVRPEVTKALRALVEADLIRGPNASDARE